MRIAQFLNSRSEVVYVESLMRSIRVVTLMVVDRNGGASRIIGVIDKKSKALDYDHQDEDMFELNKEEMVCSKKTLEKSADDLLVAIDHMRLKNIRRMTIVSSIGEAIGILSLDDVKNCLVDMIDHSPRLVQYGIE